MILLFIINAVSIFGYATFVLNPQLLSHFSWAPPIFAVSFPFFAQSQILLAFLVMAFRCHQDFGKKWYFHLLVALVISFIMEYGGTTYGIPFGKYSYSSFLGWKIAGQVPILIPLSWFFMAFSSYMIAEQILGDFRWPFAKTLLGSVLLVTWDLTLDPAMSHLTSFWIWEEVANPLLKIPIKNLVGWLFTGILILGCFELKSLKIPAKWNDNQFPLKFYAVNLMLPIGFSIAGQLWTSVVATLIVFALCFWISVRTGGLRHFFKTEQK
ncbi:MAG: carotenoid biosynthesis protein [Moraxellaceae bacterium]|nr:carotenoid biosynthesis protein [Pseudobdellovibrionaceae bacterium]